MTTPIHTRPFNADHAKAGAPYCCRNGEEATVLKWDCRDSEFPLGGVFGAQDDATNWNAQGLYNCSLNAEYDLVMLPLGMIEGKPVFVGDEFIEDGMSGVAKPIHANADWTRCLWPAPAKAYPKSCMSLAQLNAAVDIPEQSVTDRARNVANAALRHAIDAGQVVVAGDRANRDMAIAQAVRHAFSAQIAAYSTGCRDYCLSYIDLAAIIAKVAP